MNPKTYQIKIESILGGHSALSHFSRSDEFLGSMGIDPSNSGLIQPSGTQRISNSNINNAVLWIKQDPKIKTFFLYDIGGSVYTTDGSTITGLSDLNDGGSSSGNGCEYYDNYMYFARDTTIARYGPLNGTPAWTNAYWTTTLSKTALVDTTYPTLDEQTHIELPNHILCRHSDGRLYITDVVDNKGAIHYIATSKTSAEGDTDDSSTYLALQVGYGLWPTAMESYGSDLVVAFYEGGSSLGSDQGITAKIAFWDTTSSNFNKILWVEFPDTLITAIKNVGGVLYFVSTDIQNRKTRVSRYLGGDSFEDIYIGDFGPSIAGAIASVGSRFFFGNDYNTNNATGSDATGSIFSNKLLQNVSNGIFNVSRATSSTSANEISATITALAVKDSLGLNLLSAWSGNTGIANNGVDITGRPEENNNSTPIFQTQIFKIANRFKITKIRVPLQGTSGDTNITFSVIVDGGNGIFTLTPITTLDGQSKAIRRSDSTGKPITGEYSFYLEFMWAGDYGLDPLCLPIVIDYEIIDE